jgi:pyruvate dehydrogenase E2 component (dihydrolipoyllysine-residue acetyltransferase)
MAEVIMPRLSDSMEEGTIVRWLKQEGDAVTLGEPLAEVETDKATVTFEAEADGTLEILVAEGETVALGALIARIGDAVPSASGDAMPSVAGHAVPSASGDAMPSASGDATPSVAAPASGNGSERVKASPLARRMAREAGIDLNGLSGSGPGGRIVKADLDAASATASVPEPESAPAPTPNLAPAQTPPAAPADTPTPTPAPAARGNKGAVTIQQLSRTQVQIAQRMAESRATVPDFTLSADVDMQQAVALRDQLRRGAHGGDVVPSYNDMVVKACAGALREHPRANAAYRDGAFELYERVNVGIAVAAQDSLIVPTVFDADGKTLLDIAREARTLVERVRQRTITPAELSGATFTVSNLGMYGVASFAAIINPPQAAILAVGELRELPVIRDGQLVPGLRMSLTLTCDHRILYGAPAAEFLARIRQLLEQPINLLL